jgi:small subunit ribosomal protein S6
MRIYENLFIVKPDATEEEIDHLVEQMSKNVSTAGGTVDKVEKWGKRRLAYRVEKHREGHYVLMQFTADSQTVREFERRLRVQDQVIKFLTVRIDETLKRLEKRKKEREKRAHRRPQAAAPQPSLAQQMLGGAAGAGEVPAHPAPGAPISVQSVPVHAAPGAPSPEKAGEPTES